MKATNWREIETRKNDYKLYFRFVIHEGKPVRIFKCQKEIPSNNDESGYFDKEACCKLKGV